MLQRSFQKLSRDLTAMLSLVEQHPEVSGIVVQTGQLSSVDLEANFYVIYELELMTTTNSVAHQLKHFCFGFSAWHINDLREFVSSEASDTETDLSYQDLVFEEQKKAGRSAVIQMTLRVRRCIDRRSLVIELMRYTLKRVRFSQVPRAPFTISSLFGGYVFN